MKLSTASFLGVATLLFACTVYAADTKDGRKILQYTRYGQTMNGATVDSNVGWSNPDANGYSVVEGVTCAAGEIVCHGREECVNLQDNLLYCGSCSVSCDSFSQVCSGGVCVCKPGLPPCATYGGRCLDAQSCPTGPSTVSSQQIVDVNTQTFGINPADIISQVIG